MEQALRYRPSHSEYASQCRSWVGLLLFGDFLSMAILPALPCRLRRLWRVHAKKRPVRLFRFPRFSDLELGERSRKGL